MNIVDTIAALLIFISVLRAGGILSRMFVKKEKQ